MMSETDGQPLFTLVERNGDEPSRIVVARRRDSLAVSIRCAIVRFGVALARRLGKTVGVTRPAEPAELLSYTPKQDKLVEGVLLLLQWARESGIDLTADAVTVAMFLADKGHLDAFGRPLFFDNYVAVEAGPVGVAATEMLDPTFDWSTVGSDGAPWATERSGDGHRLDGGRGPNLRRLSQSDVEALTSAYAMVTTLDAAQLRPFTHRQPAYAVAWRDGAGAGSRLDPRLIPDERDDEMIDDLLYASRHAFVAPHR